MILLPIGHDRQVTRQLPLVTIFLIALNICFFILTSWQDAQQIVSLESSLKNLLKFEMEHPRIKPDQAALDRKHQLPQYFVEELSVQVKAEQIKQSSHSFNDSRINLRPDEIELLQKEMGRLASSFVGSYDDYWGFQYAFIPAFHKSSWLNYFSSMFLHGGLMHLFGNMLFLFLAGIAIEDAWGKLFFLSFYLVSGVVATATHAFTAPDSKTQLVGASGAIAGLMGAFMVRYFRAKIKFFYLLIIYPGTFRAPAFLMLPVWIALELKDSYSIQTMDSGGVAFWSHIGGFFFGAVVATIIRYSWLEKLLTPKKSRKAVSFGTGNALVEAKEHLVLGENDEAIRKLKQRVAAVPNDFEALLALAETHGKLGQREAEVRTYHRLINQHLRVQQMEQSLNAYNLMLETYSADEKQHRLVARDWMLLCDYLRARGRLAEAAGEYEKLGFAYEPEDVGFLAFVLAAETQMLSREYEYAANIFAYVRQNFRGDPSLIMRCAENESQIANILRGRNAA